MKMSLMTTDKGNQQVCIVIEGKMKVQACDVVSQNPGKNKIIVWEKAENIEKNRFK